MAFRNPNGQPSAGFGMLPYHQQMYMPGNMSMGPPGQQQQPRPGSAQFMQQRAPFPGGVAVQRYPIMQQGMVPQQGFPPQMYGGQMPAQQAGLNMQQQMNYQQQQQQQQQQQLVGQPQQLPAHMQQSLAQQQSQQRQLLEQQKRLEEQTKKERYFQEQQRKLKQFGRVGGKAASVDVLNINLDDMFVKGGSGGRGAGKGATTAQAKPRQTKPASIPGMEDDGFGDFLQGPTPPLNTPQTPTADPILPQGHLASPVGQPVPQQPPSQDEGFGDFLQGSGGEGNGRLQEVEPSGRMSRKEGKKVRSLETMMLDSTDLKASSKAPNAFHQRKPLRDSQPAAGPTSQSQRQQTFNAHHKARQWSSAENFSTMFGTPDTHPEQSGGGQTDCGQPLGVGSSIVSSQGGDGKAIPAWCMNEASLPIVYHQVLEASIRDNVIETNLLYPILMLSGLDKPVLGHIWALANQTIPGQLTRLELYFALGMIALTQNGQQPSIEALTHCREAPLPVLTPKGQPGPQTIQQSLAKPATGMEAMKGPDEFVPFQEAPKTKPNAKSTQHVSELSGSKPSSGSSSKWGSSVTVKTRKSSEDEDTDRQLGMDSSLKFPKEEENCYIFSGSPADSSSERSSPLVWDPNSIYDKLTCGSQESVSSGSLSDRTPIEDDDDDDDDDDDFNDFKSAPGPSKMTSSSSLGAFPSIAPPRGNNNGAMKSTTSAASKQSKFASSGMRSLDSPLDGKSRSSYSSEEQQKIDLFQMDFEKVFPKVGKKGSSSNEFGSFQTVTAKVSPTVQEDEEFGDFAQFKHSASESDLMGMQPANGDKYAVFRDLLGVDTATSGVEAQQIKSTEITEGDEFDDFKKAEPAKEESLTGGGSDSMAAFKEATQMPPSFTANFQDAYPVAAPQASLFGPSQSLPTINLSTSLPEEEDGFADFKQAMPMPSSTSDAFNLKSDSVSTSSSEDKYNVLRGLGSVDDPGPPDDEFGDFKTTQHSTTDSLSAFSIKSIDENNLGGMKKPVSASDLYGMEFDALGSINSATEPMAMLNLEDAPENERSDILETTTTNPVDHSFPSAAPNSFQSMQNSGIAKLNSIDRLDLKTFELDLTLGNLGEMESKDRGDSFGEFSSAPVDMTSPVENGNLYKDTSGPLSPSYGVSSVPLVPSGSSLIADRYSEVVGDVDDENRHASEWQRCLQNCYESIKKANNIFNNISSSSVCNEVIKSSEGGEYLTAVIEIYRVACRIVTSMNAMGVDTADLQRLEKGIELVWNNLSAFLASSTIVPAAGSFVFKTAILRPEPTNNDRACGVCLLSVDSRSKAFDHSKDSHKLSYGGRQYHATCANLWVNMVDSILPALPLNRLL